MTVSATARGRAALPWGTTWMLLAFMLVNFADKAVLGLAGPDLMRDLDISRQQFGTAQSAFFALFSVSAIGVSYLTRTVRTTVLLLAMALLWSAAQTPLVWGAAGFGTLVATRVLLGAAEGRPRRWRCTMCTAGSRSGSGRRPRRCCCSAARSGWPWRRRRCRW
ncbi:hypothetical protein [Actinomadura madurae]|uniref:hypothetical protein n=1 Tax=Actinomadura madurae TaxID=1993 RepID=UPI0020D225C0|nr:hypothetical protein [Actinomadura madurae]MCQ0005797.1 hypothetical protein [Actinomadura madurae]